MGLEEAIINALKKFLKILFQPLEGAVREYADQVLNFVVGTDAPNAVFSRPTNGVWPQIYDYYWESVVPLALALWGLSIGLVILLESTSNLFSGYQTSKLKRRAFAGLLGVLSWWWIAAFSLQFANGLTGFIVPDLSQLSLFDTVSYAGISVIGYALSMSVNSTLLIALAVVYLARRVALYLFVLLMPILIVMWIPSLGPFASVGNLMKRLGRFYVPFLFMTLPTAMLFRLGHVLGAGAGLSVSGFMAWLVALVIPFLALIAPIVLFWQAGAMFLASERIGRQMSRQRASNRMGTVKAAGTATAHGGRNFARGVKGSAAVTRDGQTKFGSRDSRAHAAGSRLHSAGQRLTDMARSGTTTNTSSESTGGARTARRGTPRSQDFEALRSRRESPSALPPADVGGESRREGVRQGDD